MSRSNRFTLRSVHSPPRPYFVEPALDISEALARCDVIDHNDPVGAPVVGGGDGAEALLSCTVRIL